MIVGVNRFAEPDEPVDIYRADPSIAETQISRLKRVRAERDSEAVHKSLEDLRSAARDGQNLLYPMKDALSRYATLGEVSDVLRDEFGVHEPREMV